MSELACPNCDYGFEELEETDTNDLIGEEIRCTNCHKIFLVEYEELCDEEEEYRYFFLTEL
jgi:hypothetical protein